MPESVCLVKQRAMDGTLRSDIYRTKRGGGNRGNRQGSQRVGRNPGSVVLKTMEKDSDPRTKPNKKSNKNSAIRFGNWKIIGD